MSEGSLRRGRHGCPLCDEPPPHEHRLPTILNSLYCALSIAEGICPDHQVPLQPVPVWPGSGVAVGAHCLRCRRFWSLDHDQRVAWDLDHDPHRPEIAEIPHWVSRLET